MPLEYPLLSNSISVDVQKLNEFLEALTKLNPTEVDGISAGAKRLVEVSSGKWQWQEYNGSSWAAVPFLQHNVDQLDGYHAAITPAATTVAVRNASGLLQDSITGNAATASSAATLSETLPVNKGGTGATTSEAARSNLGVPPTSHASTATTYGVANATQYGHVKLSDATDSLSGATGGIAATPTAVKAAKDAADAAQSSADAAMTKASTLATASAPGIIKPGTGMTVDAAGALNVNTASTSMAGIVQLNNTVTSTSTTQAASASAVKTAYDKAKEASDDVRGKLDSTTVHLVETWKSNDGFSWYRKWSDGWIEQGGFIATTSSSKESAVTFSIPYSNTKYTLVFGGISTGADIVMNQRDLGEYASPTGHKSVSGFSVYTRPTISRNWYACGY